MNAILLSIGDELILGQIVDTNSAWLSSQLAAIGIPVSMHITAPDDLDAICQVITMSAGQADVLIISGGLGPTADDLTRDAIAKVLNQPLELNESWVKELERFFAERRRPMPEMNKVQAMIPRGAKMLWNSCGTAPGIAATLGKCQIFCTPGVPREMHEMFKRDILPEIEPLASGAVILSRSLHTFGMGESTVGGKARRADGPHAQSIGWNHRQQRICHPADQQPVSHAPSGGARAGGDGSALQEGAGRVDFRG